MKIVLEVTAWLAIVVVGCIAVTLGELSIRGASLLCVFLMLGLTASAWWNFEGGRHPCFLFLGMLFIFQCGRLLGYMTGYPESPFDIAVQAPVPFSVSRQSEEITLLLIALSAICVYTTCRFSYRRVVFSTGPEQAFLRPLYMLMALTLPFAVYRNYLYLSFLRSHGGYLAIFTDTQALLQSAGIMIRGVGLIGTSALLLLYVFEQRRGHIALILSLFLTVSTMDLLIGLRGKFFVQILVFWFIRNLKRGKKFNLVPLLSAVVLISILAVVIAGFRENQAVKFVGPLGFVSDQGVSMAVTELAVEDRQLFVKNAGRYLIGDVKSMFVSNNDNFASDLSLYLYPEGFKRGAGTGSSYLAEAYLYGGVSGVVVASILVGLALSWLHNHSGSWIGAVLMIASLGEIIYMPRNGLMNSLLMTLHLPVAFAAVFALIYVMTGGRSFNLRGGSLHEQKNPSA